MNAAAKSTSTSESLAFGAEWSGLTLVPQLTGDPFSRTTDSALPEGVADLEKGLAEVPRE